MRVGAAREAAAFFSMSKSPKVAVSRRERENAQRSAEILGAARKILGEEGIVALTMRRLADVSGFSRPTVYKYFPTQEQVLYALALEAQELRVALARRVAGYEGSSRERMIAIGEINVVLFPQPYSFPLFSIARNVREHADAASRAKMHDLIAEYHAVRLGIVGDAVASGDLELPQEVSESEIVELFATTVTGMLGVAGYAGPTHEVAIGDPVESARRMVRTLLDALGWHPLSNESDHEEMLGRIHSELFPPELQWEIRRRRESPAPELALQL